MDFEKLARERYSLRKFADTPVEPEKLEKVLEAGRISPTAKNFQSQRVFVLQSPEALAKCDQLTPCRYGSPCVLVVGYDKDEAWVRDQFDNKNHGEIDSAITATHMMLQAADLGVGSVWVGIFDIFKVNEMLGIPENIVITAFLPLGYPAEGAHPAKMHETKFPMEHMVTFL
jgi:nitroreductase